MLTEPPCGRDEGYPALSATSSAGDRLRRNGTLFLRGVWQLSSSKPPANLYAWLGTRRVGGLRLCSQPLSAATRSRIGIGWRYFPRRTATGPSTPLGNWTFAN